MLIEFSITNFRSIKETQSLSMITADSLDELPNNICMIKFPAMKQKKQERALLKSAAIYGPNASGKSNLIDALEYMQSFIIHAARQQRGDEMNWVAPFKLNSKTLKQPSIFKIVFELQNLNKKRLKYEYGFSITKERVLEEWLYEYRSSHITRLFVRKYQPKKKNYTWHFGGGLKVGDFHQRTLENVLFLSKAAQENHEYLSPIFDWFRQTLMILPSSRNNAHICRNYLKTDFDRKKIRLLHFLQDADMGIADLQMVQQKIDIDDKKFPADMPPEQKAYIKEQLGTKLQSIHVMKDTNQKVVFDFLKDESDGTIAMLALATILIEAADCEHILIIDEIDKSLHPLLINALLKAFHKFTHNSQLIFTIHNIQQMDEEMFRKDQIWLIEKIPQTEASSLFRLSDLKGIRKEHAFDRRYLLGAYGALPILGDFDLRNK